MEKKPVMIAVDVLRAVLIVLIPVLFLMEALTLDRLYLLVFVTAIVSTVFGPALSSALPLIAPPDRLVGANALLQSTSNVGLLVGPAVSGVGIAFMGAQTCYMSMRPHFLSPLSACCRFAYESHRARRDYERWDGRQGLRKIFPPGSGSSSWNKRPSSC